MAARVNPFPYPVQSLADLPGAFQRAVQASLRPGEPVNSILMIPPQPYLRRGGIPAQALISTPEGLLQIMDMPSPGEPAAVTFLPGKALLYAHHSLLLLYGRLELAGVVDGRLVRMVIEYNTVGEYLLEAVLKKFLRFTYGWPETEKAFNPSSDDLLDELGEKSIKFMNGLRLYALQPGEKLLGYVFQPRIRRPFLRFFQLPVAPTSLLALTDQALILIEEDKAEEAAYGWIVTLCPLKYVRGVETRPDREWCQASVFLERDGVNEARKLTIENETARVWESLRAGKISH